MHFHWKLMMLASAVMCSHALIRAQQYTVRPCSHDDLQVATSAKAKAAIGENPDLGGLCETLTLAPTSDPLIIRLHTPIHIDYSHTTTLVRNPKNSEFAVVRSGEGLHVLADPDAGENKRILNNLLANAGLARNASDLTYVSDLYAFMLDIENRKGLFSRPEREHPLERVALFDPTKKQTSDVTVSLQTRRGLCTLSYTKRDGFFQLSNAVCLQT